MKHIESWNVEPSAVVKSLLKPSAKKPSNSWEKSVLRPHIPISHPHLSACLHSDTLDSPRSSGRFTPVSLRFHAPLVLDAPHAVHALEHMVGGRPELRGRPSFPGSSRQCMTGTQAPAGWQLPAPFCGGMPSQWSPFPLSARASQAMDCRCAATLLAHITAFACVSRGSQTLSGLIACKRR